jgi:hypothetical protein
MDARLSTTAAVLRSDADAGSGGVKQRINLQGLIRLDQVEHILNSLMQRIDDQDVLISRLTDQCAHLQSQTHANSQYARLADICGKMQTQLDSVSSAAMARVDNDKR